MKLSIKQILAAKKPSDIFTSEKERYVQYKNLVKIFHPDVCKIADKKTSEDVMSVVNAMYNRPFKNIVDIDGIKIPYEHHVKFDVGDMYVDKTEIHFHSKHKKFVKNFLLSFPFRNNEEKIKIAPALPSSILFQRKDKNSDDVITIPLPPCFYPLQMVKDALGESPPKHIAWIVSRLMYFGSYLDENNLMNGGLSAKTVFIHPESHSLLVPNWFFSKRFGQKMDGINALVKNNIPVGVIQNKLANRIIDQESIKQIARGLGKSEGAIEHFLKIPVKINTPTGNLFAEWNKALDSTYGKRKFLEFPKFKLY